LTGRRRLEEAGGDQRGRKRLKRLEEAGGELNETE
jgi:hypothetical protein